MALEAKKLGYYYNKNEWIFRDIDLKIQRGEILGIFGYSGCGKTSLSKVLSDFLPPKEGAVFVDGKAHSSHGFREVQLICQHPEKIMNPLWRMKKILEEAYVPEPELLETFGVKGEWMERYPIELSGGELQRFSIVRALHPQTKYLIADEMTTMLDAITQEFIWRNLLQIVSRRNLGLIVISHDHDLIERICDCCFYMESRKMRQMKK